MGFADLYDKRKEHFLGGGKEKQQEQRKKEKMTAFERIMYYLIQKALKKLIRLELMTVTILVWKIKKFSVMVSSPAMEQ
jgi:acetyl-CoA carboxylase carboxyltransferase component